MRKEFKTITIIRHYSKKKKHFAEVQEPMNNLLLLLLNIAKAKALRLIKEIRRVERKKHNFDSFAHGKGLL